MSYQNKIDDEYQKQIDDFIARRGVTELSVTDNQLGDNPSYAGNHRWASRRVRLSKEKENSSINKLKSRLASGDVVRNLDYKDMGFKNKKSIAVCVTAMRKAGWDIETVYGIGYRLIKKGGYVHW